MFNKKIQPAQSIQNVYNSAHFHLNRRDMSEHELLTKLNRKTDNQEWIETVMQDCRERGYLNDDRFVESFIRRCYHEKKIGENKISSLLVYEKKVIDPSIISDKLTESGLDFFELALTVARKKVKGDLKEHKVRSKLFQNLMVKGFTSEQISYAIEGLKTES